MWMGHTKNQNLKPPSDKEDGDFNKIVFGEGFAGDSDLEAGPDGYLYVVSLGQEKTFRTVPSS